MFQVNMRMKGIVENINVKMEMAHVMQNTLRERSLSMYYMIIVKDDFLKTKSGNALIIGLRNIILREKNGEPGHFSRRKGNFIQDKHINQ